MAQAVQPQPLLLFDDEGAAGGDADACMPGLGPEPVPLNHYLQNLISPRSRSEYDEFNRFHFSRLKQQGRDKRAITPKVCVRKGLMRMCVLAGAAFNPQQACPPLQWTSFVAFGCLLSLPADLPA
jgi:hypothetical protein